MEKNDLEARIRDLANQRDRRDIITHTPFLTPAEQSELDNFCAREHIDGYVFLGGNDDAERRIAFFLPYYVEQDGVDLSEYITAFQATSRFASPGHRDYLGSLIGLGIERDCIGDIYVSGETAYFYVVKNVAGFVDVSMDRVGNTAVKIKKIDLDEVKPPKREFSTVTFTVKSMRLDAIAAGIFRLSRTKVVSFLSAGAVSLNYNVCMKPDAQVGEGDVISLRGKGKAKLAVRGGTSKRDRIFVTAEIYQ